MLEKGIVTELKGDMATVKVQRLVNTGCGCGNMLTTEDTLVEVKNLCHANLNDPVALNSIHEITSYRNIIQAIGASLAFIMGIAAGEHIFPYVGITPKTSVSVGFGLVLGTIAFLTIRGIYRKKSLPVPVAYKLLHSTTEEKPPQT